MVFKNTMRVCLSMDDACRDYRAHQPHLRLCFRELKHGFTISAFSLSMPGIRLILAHHHAIMQSRNQADLSRRSYEGSHEAHTPRRLRGSPLPAGASSAVRTLSLWYGMMDIRQGAPQLLVVAPHPRAACILRNASYVMRDA